MGGKKVLVIYENKQINGATFTAEVVVYALELLQEKEKYEIKDYSFEEFAEKDDGDVQFWKAVIICNNADNFPGKVSQITKKFDPEHGSPFRVISAGQPILPADSPITADHVIPTPNMGDITTWWPAMLRFLFPRESKKGEAGYCLLLFDGDNSMTNVEEWAWYQRTSGVLQSLDMTCKWIGQFDEQPEDKLKRPDFVVVMSRLGGVPMLSKSKDHFKQKIKTIVLTDDANSHTCKMLKRSLKKAYLYPSQNPLELSFTGWSMLLRELKLIECEDIVFKEKRSKKKMMLILMVIIALFVILPLVLAIIAAFGLLHYCGVDVGAVCDCCCCLSDCCGSCCMDCIMEVPCCHMCLFVVRPEEDIEFDLPEMEVDMPDADHNKTKKKKKGVKHV